MDERVNDAGGRQPAIVARGLHKAYRGVTAVASVDLEVAPGTVLGLLGPNGAGKTTLIRMLTTVLPPDAGTFTVGGVPHTRPDGIRARTGVLPESAGYPANQTCEEWLTYHARLFGASRGDARTTARRCLEEVGLGARRSSLVARLSRGLRQRLGIARALVNDPDVLFLDEPTLGLDPMGQRQVLDLVTGVARDHGVTVVLSTHVLAEVEQICQRVVILNQGVVVADGTVADVVRRAAAPRRATVEVSAAWASRALEVLGAETVVTPSGSDGSRTTLQVALGEDVEAAAASALRRLVDAGVPVLGLSVEGGRLSDAFLTVTAGSRP